MGRVLGYGLLRIVTWLVLWYLLILAGLGVYIAGVLAVLIAMMLSFLLFGGVRRRAAEGLQEVDERRRERRGPEVDEDAESEDALLDGDAAEEERPGAAAALPGSNGIAAEDDVVEDGAVEDGAPEPDRTESDDAESGSTGSGRTAG